MLTLLVAMDGSPLDGRSLGYATALAKPNNGAVALLSVVPDVALREPTIARLAEMAEHVRSSAGRVGWESVLLVVAGLGGYVLFLKLPWTRWLGTQPSAPVTRPAQP